MARQNGRLAPWRDYAVADSLLKQAYNLATEAANSAVRQRGDLHARAQFECNDLRSDLKAWRAALDGSLNLYKAERYWSAADLALRTSEGLIDKREYSAALETAAQGHDALVKLSHVLDEYANDEAQKIHVWRRWVRETVDGSRAAGTNALVVDKAAHKLYLVQAGRMTRVFKCELGYNSARQKFFSGDGATPEGKYHITKKRPNGSKYYKALMLSYPNETDKARFSQNKARGIISRYARIGGLIEIHGDGGQHRDWTDGCVALTNDEMDALMPHVAAGTPVTIVRRSDQWP